MIETLLLILPVVFTLSVVSISIIEIPEDIVIKNISVSSELGERGLGDRTATHIIEAEILTIVARSHSYNETHDAREIYVATQSEGAFSELLTSLDLSAAVDAVQTMLGLVDNLVDIHISQDQGGQLTAGIRILDARTLEMEMYKEFHGEVSDPKSLFIRIAHFLVRELEPFVFAVYLFNNETSDNKVLIKDGVNLYPETKEFLREKIIIADEGDLHYYYNLLGVIAHREGHWREAIGYYEKALRIEPDFHLAIVNWGWTLSALGRYDAAISKFRQAIGIRRDTPIAQLYWAATLMRAGKMDAALRRLEKAEALAPSLADVYRLRAHILQLERKSDRKVEHAEKRAELAWRRHRMQHEFLPIATIPEMEPLESW